VTRDEQVVKTMGRLFGRGEAKSYALDASTRRQLESLFGTMVFGFREIMLVVVVARLLDESYDPHAALYDCNPRSLYEGRMVEELRKRGIPHRKSGPLNIAKAAQGLNAQWAAQRRPKHVADDVVRLVKKLKRMSQAEVENFGAALAGRLLQEATRIAKLTVEALPESGPKHLYDLSWKLIDNAPDAGNTPQRIVGLLMQSYHEELQTGIKVEGHLDRASVTSTTSKKPGDITEEQLDGTVLVVYEVTVKRFGQGRLIDSYDTVKAYNELSGSNIKEVIVICRGQDAHEDAEADEGDAGIYLGTVTYEDMTYHFLEVYEWAMAQLGRMPVDARLAFHAKLSAYVAEPNTSEAVKREWAALNDE